MQVKSIRSAIISHQKARALTGPWFPRLKRGLEYPGRGGGVWVGYNGVAYYTRPAIRAESSVPH